MERIYFACDKSFKKAGIGDCVYLAVFNLEAFLKSVDEYVVKGIEEYYDGDGEGTVYCWSDWEAMWKPVGNDIIVQSVFESSEDNAADYYAVQSNRIDITEEIHTLAAFKSKKQAEKWAKNWGIKFYEDETAAWVVPQSWGELTYDKD